MTFKHLLVHVDSGDRLEERLDLAVTVAKRSGARLVGLFAESGSLGSSLVGRRSPQQLQAAAAKAKDAFTRKASATGLDGEWWPIDGGSDAEIVELATACCRYVDLAILGQHEGDRSRAPAEMLERVVLDSGRPVLVVPAAGRYADVGKRIVVGWNASRAAARALNDALPLMLDAERVRVLAFQRPRPAASALAVPNADIVAHLELHGVRATYERVVEEREGVSAATTLLNHGFELQADLTVVGADGHALLLPHANGFLRELLRSMATPLFVAA